MYEFWYDYIKQKYQDKAKLFYMNTVLLLIPKLTIFMKILQIMLEKDFIHQIMK